MCLFSRERVPFRQLKIHVDEIDIFHFRQTSSDNSENTCSKLGKILLIIDRTYNIEGWEDVEDMIKQIAVKSGRLIKVRIQKMTLVILLFDSFLVIRFIRTGFKSSFRPSK